MILDAAVDEYGLRESVTHVELAARFAEHLGIPSEAIHSRAHACRSAVEIGDALFGWYRDEPPAFSLGVHTASEVTSVTEFMSWHDVFLNFPQYRFSLDQPEFEYMRAHYVHEPDHILGARRCVGRYLELFPDRGPILRDGVQSYLKLYGRMFAELDSLIFK